MKFCFIAVHDNIWPVNKADVLDNLIYHRVEMEAKETTQRVEAAMSKWTVAISYTSAATNRRV